MNGARSSPLGRAAVHAVLIAYTALCLSPVLLVIVNSFKSRATIFGAPLSLPGPGSFDLVGYLESRASALLVLRTALREPDWSALFRMTEAFRAGAEGQEKTQALLRSLRSLLRDLLVIKSGQPAMARNGDLARELSSLADGTSFGWIESAVRGVDEVEAGMRRNLLRSLSLDAMAGGLRAAAARN